MTAQELIELARGLLDDTIEPYLWSDDFLVTCLNRAIRTVCERVKHLRDTSSSFCSIELLSGQPIYNVDPRILVIESITLASNGSLLERKDPSWMDHYVSNWRNQTGNSPVIYIPEYEYLKFRIYPYYEDTYVVTGDQDISFQASGRTILRASGGLSVFQSGDSVNIQNTSLNNKTVTIETAEDTSLVVSESLEDESNTSAILRRVEDLAQLSVIRLPLQDISVSDLSVEPEIPEENHLMLLDGLLGYAFLKRDTETYDPQASMKHFTVFYNGIAEMRKKYIQKTSFMQTLRPHRGSL